MPTDEIARSARAPGWLARAAVLSVFDINWITPVAELDEAETVELSEFLAASCERVVDENGSPSWQLHDDARRQVLRGASNAELRAALEGVTGQPDDPVQDALTRYVHEAAPALDELDAAGLSAELQLAQWLGTAEADTSDSIKARLDWLAVTEPLRRLIARGLLGQEKLLGQCHYFIENETNERFLLIEGVTGSGKSSVLAQLILDMRVPGILAAYLSLDRAWLLDGGPQAIFNELVRQIGTQLPAEHRRAANLLRQQAQGKARRRKGFGDVTSRSVHNIEEINVAQLQELRGLLNGRARLLVVLDTMEELARRDEALRTRVLTFLEDLSVRLPMVRIIAAGRSMPSALYQRHKVWLLTGLAPLDALALMRALTAGTQITDRALREIVNLVGGNPLSLRLAADVLNRTGDNPALVLAVTEDNVQGQLYSRLLEHIRDPRVRAVAHPGLMVRRISPEIIRDVLAEPCGIAPLSEAEARGIFRALRQEATLCDRSRDGDGALVHRQDVRAIMLPAIRRDRPGTTKVIHEAAVRYYMAAASDDSPMTTTQARRQPRQTGLLSSVARREELYHRLMLDQSWDVLDERWTPTESWDLANVIDELPVRGQLYLANKLPELRLDPELRAAAADDEWRQAIRPRALSAIAIGEPDTALALAIERRDAGGHPLLPDVEVEALERLGHVDEALSVAATAREQAAQHGDTDLVRTLITVQARIHERLRGWQTAWRLWQSLAAPDRARRERTDALDEDIRLRELVVLTSLLRVARHLNRADREVADLRTETVELAERTPPRILTGTATLLRDLAAEIGEDSRTILALAERTLGEQPRSSAEQTVMTYRPETADDEVEQPTSLAELSVIADIHEMADDETAAEPVERYRRATEAAQDYLVEEREEQGRAPSDAGPDALTKRNNLAYAYQSAGDLSRAIPLYEQTLADSVRVLGADHPDTLTTRNNLAYAYQSAGDLSRAIPLYEQTLADRLRVLGADHPDTLNSRNNLAYAYRAAGDLSRAIPLYEQTLADSVRVLGADHPDTLTTRNNLAYAYRAAGDLSRAIPLYEQTLADRLQVLGADHPDTLNSRNNLAYAYRAAGDLSRAIPLYEQTLADSVRVLGADHPQTKIVRGNLAAARQHLQ